MTPQARLDAQVRAAVHAEAPGVVLVVVGPEGVRASAAVGAADLDRGTPMGDGVGMPWFSMTKMATATTVLRLVERGQLDLDAPVAPLVPAVRRLRPAEWAERITLRHLLQHTAGLANPVPVRWIHPAAEPPPEPDDFLETRLRRAARLRSEPGGRSRYSNLGTLVAGAAVEHARDEPFELVVRRELLDPAAMNATGFAVPADVPAAVGYHPRRGPARWLLPRWVVGEPAGRWVGLRPFLLDGAAYGGLVGTPADAARLLQLHLGDGEVDGVRVLHPDTATLMRRIDAPGRRFDLGLGWFVPADDRGARPAYVEHLGAGAGFFNVMRMYVAERVGAVVMGNATSYDVDAVARLALDYAA
ncbi:MAG: serine hydrolase domain-containing protein [Nocardioidaceae bacterium]